MRTSATSARLWARPSPPPPEPAADPPADRASSRCRSGFNSEDVMSLTVAFPLYESFDTLDVMGPLQAFLYAGWTSTLLAQTKDGVRSLEGVTVMPDDTFDCATRFDILFVPGGADVSSVLALGKRGANP